MFRIQVSNFILYTARSSIAGLQGKNGCHLVRNGQLSPVMSVPFCDITNIWLVKELTIDYHFNV